MKVFVSSTYDDLSEYREHVLQALIRCEAVYKGMEFFGASSNTTLEHCLSEINAADLVICLLGTRYGSCPPGSPTSYTEHEINHAIQIGRPIHFYLIDDEQPVRPRFYDVGEAAVALSELKARLSEHVTPCRFTSPPDLAMKIMQSIFGGRKALGPAASISDAAALYREAAYDAIADWYDLWYKDHWCNREPFMTVRRILSRHLEAKVNLTKLKILDVACGTGNAYAAFKDESYDISGCDGSGRMLAKALENCRRDNIQANGIISDPINWTDSDAYERHFSLGSFDVIINTANSFCHLPPVDGYMDVALRNFNALLKPGGLLVIDTKKYIREGDISDIPLYKELRYVAPEWIVRTVRNDPCDVSGLENIRFNTRLHYDLDPAFDAEVLRALIVLTIYGKGITPQTALIPYYPLPAADLETHMRRAGFATTTYGAGEGPAENWRYDVLVGRKTL